MPTETKTVIEAKEVAKNYIVGSQEVKVLKGVTVTINAGDFFIIFGPSGCGKSTLLHLMLGLEKPSSGTLSFLGEDLGRMSEDEIATFRKTRVGLVFQASYWIKSLSVAENVAFPLFLEGKMPSEAIAKAVETLKIVGMADWANYAPTELSSGQQQKVGLARALVINPTVVVTDEPTGNLDSQSGEELMSLLTRMNQEEKLTVIMVTHDLEYLKYANRVIHIVDGQIVEEYDESNKNKLKEHMVSKRGAAAKGIREQDTEYLAKMKQEGGKVQ